MMDDRVPLTWVEAPPPPGAAPPALADALAALRTDGAVTLTGVDGSGRTLIVDARIQADASLLAAIRPPAGWHAILLAPREVDAATAWGPRLDLPDPAAPAALAGDDAAVLAAASYFDPWEGAPRILLAAVAGLAADATDAALGLLLATGRLRPASDPARVLTTLHDYQARPEVTDPRERPYAERFVAAIATLCGRTIHDTTRALAPDRANVMTALAIWPAVAPPGLVTGFDQHTTGGTNRKGEADDGDFKHGKGAPGHDGHDDDDDDGDDHHHHHH